MKWVSKKERAKLTRERNFDSIDVGDWCWEQVLFVIILRFRWSFFFIQIANLMILPKTSQGCRQQKLSPILRHQHYWRPKLSLFSNLKRNGNLINWSFHQYSMARSQFLIKLEYSAINKLTVHVYFNTYA